MKIIHKQLMMVNGKMISNSFKNNIKNIRYHGQGTLYNKKEDIAYDNL